jgi:two-component system OmpR family sensor kinase
MSLKLRLTFLSVLLMVVTVALIGLASYHFVADALARQVDAALEDRADEVLDDISNMGTNFYTDHDFQLAASTRPQAVPVAVQILDHDGNIRYTSDLQGRPTMPIDPQVLRQALKGATVTIDAATTGDTDLRIRYSPLPNANQNPAEVLEVGTPLANTAATLNLMRLLLFASAVLTAVLVGVGVWVAATRTLAAVAQVTDTASTIELSRNLNERIPEDSAAGDAEMDRLVRTFNSMLDRISASFAAQRQFVADSSHELRSPLTVIRGNLDLLRRTQNPEERAAITRLIEDEAARMSRLVDNLLFLAQLEEAAEGHASLNRRPVELDSLLLTVYQQARSMTTRHTIQLGDEDAITIDGDRDQLQQLLLNLVDNAIKYTPSGGTITLSLRSDGDDALLEVRDTGIGISAEELPHIFDRFYRVDKARSRRIGGAGLGLSIVQGIAAAHGGAVAVESTASYGSTFEVRLPRTAPAPTPVPAPLPATARRDGSAADPITPGRRTA